MANKPKNQYMQKAKKKHFLAQMNEGLPTKGHPKNTMLETGKDILVGVLGGGLIGAAIGKPSMLVGIVTTGVGHYSGNKLVQILGIGMMASNGFQKSTTVSGLEGLDGVKERVKAFKESMSDRFYLDKIMKKKTASTTSGIGELQYFNYPDTMGELAALNDIEKQIEESALQFKGGANAEEYEVGDVDLDERLM